MADRKDSMERKKNLDVNNKKIARAYLEKNLPDYECRLNFSKNEFNNDIVSIEIRERGTDVNFLPLGKALYSFPKVKEFFDQLPDTHVSTNEIDVDLLSESSAENRRLLTAALKRYLPDYEHVSFSNPKPETSCTDYNFTIELYKRNINNQGPDLLDELSRSSVGLALKDETVGSLIQSQKRFEAGGLEKNKEIEQCAQFHNSFAKLEGNLRSFDDAIKQKFDGVSGLSIYYPFTGSDIYPNPDINIEFTLYNPVQDEISKRMAEFLNVDKTKLTRYESMAISDSSFNRVIYRLPQNLVTQIMTPSAPPISADKRETVNTPVTYTPFMQATKGDKGDNKAELDQDKSKKPPTS